MRNLIILFLFTVLPLKAAENIELEQDDLELSFKYFAGEYLLYDCVDHHWVCTQKSEFAICQQQHNIALERLEVDLPCAPIKQFKDRKTCEVHMTELINSKKSVRFCLHPQFNERKLIR